MQWSRGGYKSARAVRMGESTGVRKVETTAYLDIQQIDEQHAKKRHPEVQLYAVHTFTRTKSQNTRSS